MAGIDRIASEVAALYESAAICVVITDREMHLDQLFLNTPIKTKITMHIL